MSRAHRPGDLLQVVFPEYCLHGLSMDTSDDILCDRDGPETRAFADACAANKIWGCFSIMERNPGKMPFNSGLIYNDQGEEVLYYRKLHPWVPVEPWEPGTGLRRDARRSRRRLGHPRRRWPQRLQTRAHHLSRPAYQCFVLGNQFSRPPGHDGMFPEMAREAAYKGAEIMLRTAGYTAPIRNSWTFTNQANAFQNLMATASVCMCGSDGTFDSMGEGMFCGHDGEILVSGSHRPDEIITCELRPDLVREARVHWAVENNIYQFGHRAYVAVKGGATDCPYTFMHDLVKGQWNLPWDDQVIHKDGTSCGFAPPSRVYEPADGANGHVA